MRSRRKGRRNTNITRARTQNRAATAAAAKHGRKREERKGREGRSSSWSRETRETKLMSSRSRPQSRNLFPHQEQVSNWTAKLSFGLSIKIWILALAPPHARPHKVLVTCLLRVETWNWDINRSTLNQDMKLRHQLVDTESRDMKLRPQPGWFRVSRHEIETLIGRFCIWRHEIEGSTGWFRISQDMKLRPWLVDSESRDMKLRHQLADSKELRHDIETSTGRFRVEIWNWDLDWSISESRHEIETSTGAVFRVEMWNRDPDCRLVTLTSSARNPRPLPFCPLTKLQRNLA